MTAKEGNARRKYRQCFEQITNVRRQQIHEGRKEGRKKEINDLDNVIKY
jgi:hypothetical protein